MSMPIFIELTEDSFDGPHCDFCFKAETKETLWTFKCLDFQVQALSDSGERHGVLNSRGNWAACEDCARLVEQNDKKTLLERIFSDPFYSDPIARAGLKTMIDGYFAYRIGPGIPPV
jgi:hypothetical protein